jgi:TPP-dependent pyruvate/acetoin dehydrogenase alpha subunit
MNYPDSLLQDLYRRMLRIRLFEEEIHYHISRGRIHGTTHLYIGEEAVAAGAAANLSDLDYITSTHRCHGHAIAKGSDLSALAAEMFGKRAGVCGGKGGSMHLADPARGNLGGTGIVGGGIPIAVGAALSIRRLGQDRVVVCFFGDGAMNEGTFHESVNLAAVWNLPVLFLCENNQYGVSTHVRRSTNVRDLSLRAAAYGIPGRKVDGMDVLAVYEAVREALGYVRRSGPLLLVAQTYRFLGHSRSDANVYRSEDEIAAWRRKDPIPAFRDLLLSGGSFPEDRISDIEEEARREVDAAFRFARTCEEPGPEDLLRDVYAD